MTTHTTPATRFSHSPIPTGVPSWHGLPARGLRVSWAASPCDLARGLPLQNFEAAKKPILT